LHQANELGARMIAYTFGYPDSMDAAFAKQICQRLRVQHKNIVYDPGKWREYLPLVCEQVEGEVDLIHMISMQFHRELVKHSNVILTGLSGGTITGSSIHKDQLSEWPLRALQQFAFHNTIEHDIADLRLLIHKDQYSNVLEELETIVEESVGDAYWENGLSGDVLSKWNLQNRQTRLILTGPKSDRYMFIVRSPFYDYDFFDFSLRVPIRLRLNQQMYIKALWHLMPELRTVMWQKRGEIPDPNRYRRHLRFRLNKVRKKFGKHLGIHETIYRNKFYNVSTLIEQGFSVSEMKKMCVKTPRKIHEWMNPGAISNIIDEHYEGVRDNGKLISKFLTLSLTEDYFASL
jgi:asparagine synthetase B (glutamine-hydrolysing)